MKATVLLVVLALVSCVLVSITAQVPKATPAAVSPHQR
jgi:hypothetical protein